MSEMDLINPRKILEKYISPYLDEFVENYEDLDFDVGLRGEITLSNVTLKQRESSTVLSLSLIHI